MKNLTYGPASRPDRNLIPNLAAGEVRLYRLPDVLARIPVSRSSWFAGIQSGRYPRGHHLGPRTTVWRSDEIDQLIDSVIKQAAVGPWTAKDLGRAAQ